jgi:hypothetical protein
MNREMTVQTVKIVADLHDAYPDDPDAALTVLCRAVEAVCIASSNGKEEALGILDCFYRTSRKEIDQSYDRFKANLKRTMQ